MNEDRKPPVPDPRTGMDEADDELVAEALEYADELAGVQTDARGRSMVRLAAEVRRLRAENATADTEANGYPLTEARLEIDRLRAAPASERAKRKCRGNECESFDCENCDDAHPVPDATALREAAKPIADAWKHGRFYIDDSGEREAITLLGISSKQVGDLYRALLATQPRDAPEKQEEEGK